MKSVLNLAERAVSAASSILREVYESDAVVASAGGRDIKTEADLAAERAILDVLAESPWPVLSEEAGAAGDLRPDGAFWVVDPLDGTFNFARGLPFCGVSVGFWKEGRPRVGVIEDLASGEVMSGLVGEGAWCDGRALRVSETDELSQAALATGFPTGRDYSAAALAATVEGIQRFKKIRMLGSAALSLAQVAAGRVDAYWEEKIWLWDVAAGLALVEAAGGAFEISPPAADWKLNVFAHNGKLGAFADLAQTG
jgi:myo-inositol-1(or 4)-monophosphatase